MSDVAETEVVAPQPPMMHGVPLSDSHGQRVLHPTRAGYSSLIRTLLDDTFIMCADLTAVDYLTFPGRYCSNCVKICQSIRLMIEIPTVR